MNSHSDFEKELIYLGLLEKAREIYVELGETAVLSYIRNSYRLLSKVYHPDLNPKNKEKARVFQQRLNKFSRLLSRIPDEKLIDLMEKGVNKDCRSKSKILIVEEKVKMQRLYKDVLLTEGYDIRLASNAVSGYKTCCLFRPDLILTDILISGVSGLELLRKVRKVSPGIKAIFISGFFMLEAVKRELEKEIHQHGYGKLAKPFKKTELLDLIRFYAHGFQNGQNCVSVYA